MIAKALRCLVGKGQVDSMLKGGWLERAKAILDTYMELALVEGRHLGLSLVVLANGETEYWNYGWADLGRQRSVSEHDFFELGSVGKVFTALLFANLLREGLCQALDPIRKFVPELPQELKINVLQLLTHTSGLSREPANFTDISPKNSFIGYTDEELTSALKTTKITSEPDAWAYSSFGYIILGLAAKRMTGSTSFSDLLATRILQPLGLPDFKIMLEGPDFTRFNCGHTLGLEPVAYLDLGEVYNPAGGLKGTVAEMGRFIGMVLNQNDSSDPLANSFTKTLELYTKTARDDVAFGWHTTIKNGHRVYYHPGHVAGAKSSMVLCPELGRGIAYCSNTLSHVRPVWEMLMGGLAG